jgi:glycosyltransferase involved in cell wall biosynthesis
LTSAEPDLSAVVLCYRAGDSILAVVEPLYELLAASGLRFELVLVANYWPNQADPTPEIVAGFAEPYDNVVVLRKEKEGGMGWDMRAGMAATIGRTIVVIDGDAQNPVGDVLRMYQLLEESGADVGKGRRSNRADGTYRMFISWAYNVLFRLLFRTWQLWDINGKPKGLTRKAYEQMRLVSNDWFVDAEIVLAARRRGLRIIELPVVFLENKERSSFVRLAAIGEFALHMARYRFRGRP